MPQPTTAKKSPETIRAYTGHGVDLDYREGEKNAPGTCPSCGESGKFDVAVADGRYHCFRCGFKGNVLSFLRWLWEESDRATKPANYEELAHDRKLLYPDTVMQWGCVKSILTGDWLIPAYGPGRKLDNLYRYALKPGKRVLYPTAGQQACLFGGGLYDPSKPEVALCEGPWDGMVLWETLRGAKRTDDGGLALTANESASLYAGVNVLAVAGCGAVGPESFPRFAPLFSGKKLTTYFDNDHPKKNERGVEVGLQGFHASKRAATILAGCDERPESMSYLAWGEEGYDQAFQSGYDVRDLLRQNSKGKLDALEWMLSRIGPIPTDWLPGRTAAALKTGGTEVELLPCRDYRTLMNSFRKAMKCSVTPGEGIDGALANMLAVVAVTRMPGDQLWLMVLSPPSTGKTALCEGLGCNRKYVQNVGSFTGLHSGISTPDGSEDNGLLARLKDRTLVIKEGDTLRTAVNREQLLTELRDAYDTNCSVTYKTRIRTREYVGLRFGVILCGTPAMLEMDSSDLGARFLIFQMMRGIPVELETEVNRRVFHRILRNRGVEANGTPETHDDPGILEAKRLTGGYVQYLREHASELLGALAVDEALEERFSALAQFVAFMRARPSKKQAEQESREMSPRLVVQLTRLGLGLAVVLNRPSLDAEVMQRVAKVALDTASGRTYELVRHLKEYERRRAALPIADQGYPGLPAQSLSSLTQHPTLDEGKLLRFLARIGAVVCRRPDDKHVSGQLRWELTPRMSRLYDAVHEVF